MNTARKQSSKRWTNDAADWVCCAYSQVHIRQVNDFGAA